MVALSSPISRVAAENNDIVVGTVLKPVVYLGRKVIESGAAVEGHLQCSLGSDRILLELDRVQTVSGWAPFYAELTKLKSAGQLCIRVTSAGDATHLAEESNLQSGVQQMSVPGVAILSPSADDSELLPGTPMVWRTVSRLAAMDDEQPPQ